jgi:hypothetical protein
MQASRSLSSLFLRSGIAAALVASSLLAACDRNSGAGGAGTAGAGSTGSSTGSGTGSTSGSGSTGTSGSTSSASPPASAASQ